MAAAGHGEWQQTGSTKQEEALCVTASSNEPVYAMTEAVLAECVY